MYDPLRDGPRLATPYQGRHSRKEIDPFTAHYLALWPAGEFRRRDHIPRGYPLHIEGAQLYVMRDREGYTRTNVPAPPPEACYARTAHNTSWPYGTDEHWWLLVNSPAFREWDTLRLRAGEVARRPDAEMVRRRIRLNPQINFQARLLMVRRVVEKALSGGYITPSAPKYALEAAMRPEVTLPFLLVDVRFDAEGKFDRFVSIPADEQIDRMNQGIADYMRAAA